MRSRTEVLISKKSGLPILHTLGHQVESFMVASGGVLSGGYGHGGTGVCLGDVQRPKEYRRKVGAATRCFVILCPLPDPT